MTISNRLLPPKSTQKTTVFFSLHTKKTLSAEKQAAFAEKKKAREIQKKFDELDRIAQAPDLESFEVIVTYKKSQTWGWIPTAGEMPAWWGLVYIWTDDENRHYEASLIFYFNLDDMARNEIYTNDCFEDERIDGAQTQDAIDFWRDSSGDDYCAAIAAAQQELDRWKSELFALAKKDLEA